MTRYVLIPGTEEAKKFTVCEPREDVFKKFTSVGNTDFYRHFADRRAILSVKHEDGYISEIRIKSNDQYTRCRVMRELKSLGFMLKR